MDVTAVPDRAPLQESLMVLKSALKAKAAPTELVQSKAAPNQANTQQHGEVRDQGLAGDPAGLPVRGLVPSGAGFVPVGYRMCVGQCT